jgi:hypothetical protein
MDYKAISKTSMVFGIKYRYTNEKQTYFLVCLFLHLHKMIFFIYVYYITRGRMNTNDESGRI